MSRAHRARSKEVRQITNLTPFKKGDNMMNRITEPAAERVHTANIPTPHGTATLKIPDSDMKLCPCGHEFYRPVSRVTLLRQEGIIGAEPVTLRIETMLCDKCGREIHRDDPTKGDAAAKTALIIGPN